MAGYDPNKDETINEFSVEGDKNTEIVLELKSYDNSPVKLALSKRWFSKDGDKSGFKKLGRLNKDEVERVLEILPTVLGEM